MLFSCLSVSFSNSRARKHLIPWETNEPIYYQGLKEFPLKRVGAEKSQRLDLNPKNWITPGELGSLPGLVNKCFLVK